MRVGPNARRQRRRPPAHVLVLRWLSVLVTATVVVAVAVVAVHHIARSVRPPGAAASMHHQGALPKVRRTAIALAAASAAKHGPPKVTPGPVTLSVVGDTELGNTPLLPPDPATYLYPVRTALAAPIVFGNLEGTLTNSTGSKCGPGSTECFAFRTPPTYAQYLHQDGFTILNSANNHSHDFGEQGVLDTSAALKAAGIAQTGLPGQIGIVHDGATSVAFIGFAPYTNTNNLLDFTTARALIQKARSEADIVVVYMHAGAEGSQADHVTGQEEYYVGEDRGNPEAFAHAAISDGANLVIASGPHVLRGMEFYKGDLIDYSMGNFAGFGNFATGGDLSLSGILRVTLSGRGGFVKASFTSIMLNNNGQPSVDPAGAAARFVAQLSQQDFGASAAQLSPAGAISPHSSLSGLAPKSNAISLGRPVSTL
jgi:Bacterial capsule synthesis protein PGA_cap